MLRFFNYSQRDVGIAVLAIAVLLTGCVFYRSRTSVLPSHRAMARMHPKSVAKLVLAVTPIGTPRADVEAALSDKFVREWSATRESVGLMSEKGFQVPVTEGDSCITSDFAHVPSGLMMAKMVTFYFLFDEATILKDVSARVWLLGP